MCIVIIIVYGILVRNVFKKDILESNFASCTGCDYWAVSHLLFFAIIAYLYPDNLLLITILGIIWEFIETFLGTHNLKIFGRRITLIGNTDETGNVKNNDNEDSWWYGRVTDIAFNLMGVIIGYTFAINNERIKVIMNV